MSDEEQLFDRLHLGWLWGGSPIRWGVTHGRHRAHFAGRSPFEQAVAAGDHALRLGLLAAALDKGLPLLEAWPGTRQARRAIAFLDARSESAGESVSRVRIHEAGLPAPVPHREI